MFSAQIPTSGMNEATGTAQTSAGGTQQSKVRSQFSSQSGSEADGVGQSETVGETDTVGRTKTVTNSEGYSEALEPIMEIRDSATYTLEEQTHVSATGLMTQPMGCATVKFSGKPPVQIRTLFLPKPVVRKETLQRTLDSFKEATPFLISRDEAWSNITFRSKALEAESYEDFEHVAETAFIEK